MPVAAASGRSRPSAGRRCATEADRDRVRRVLVDLAAEADQVVVADLPDVDARARTAVAARRCRTVIETPGLAAAVLGKSSSLQRWLDAASAVERRPAKVAAPMPRGDAVDDLRQHDRERGRARPASTEKSWSSGRPRSRRVPVRGDHVEAGERASGSACRGCRWCRRESSSHAVSVPAPPSSDQQRGRAGRAAVRGGCRRGTCRCRPLPSRPGVARDGAHDERVVAVRRRRSSWCRCGWCRR